MGDEDIEKAGLGKSFTALGKKELAEPGVKELEEGREGGVIPRCARPERPLVAECLAPSILFPWRRARRAFMAWCGGGGGL